MTTLTTAERFALDEWLSEYPKDVSYQEILEMILRGAEEISVWVVAEDYPEYQIVEIIDSTFNHFTNVTSS